MKKYVALALVFVVLALACAIQEAPGGVVVWFFAAVIAVCFGIAAKARGVRLEHEALRRRADAEHAAYLDRWFDTTEKSPHLKWMDEQ